MRRLRSGRDVGRPRDLPEVRGAIESATMTDRDGNRSNPYRPDPAHCCEACVFGRGEHAEWCEWVTIYCPTCYQESAMNKRVLGAPPHLNVNRCLHCFTEVRLV